MDTTPINSVQAESAPASGRDLIEAVTSTETLDLVPDGKPKDLYLDYAMLSLS